MTRRRTQLETDQWIADLVKDHVQAALRGVYFSRPTPYFYSCRRQNLIRGITTIFTRDEGYHASGWWKNPDYERCYHLSLSSFHPITQETMATPGGLTSKLVKAFFTGYAKWVWVEGPYSSVGRKHGVHHYRLFCDEAWQPIKPRGEVYSRELTEAGWKSFSDVQAALAETGRNPNRCP